jgi:hypothetical protein
MDAKGKLEKNKIIIEKHKTCCAMEKNEIIHI